MAVFTRRGLQVEYHLSMKCVKCGKGMCYDKETHVLISQVCVFYFSLCYLIFKIRQ